MPTNELRIQAARLLQWALKAQKDGNAGEAHDLTLMANQRLEDAISLEELRWAASQDSAEEYPSSQVVALFDLTTSYRRRR